MAKSNYFAKFAQDYLTTFEIEMPDGETLQFEFRLPSAAQIWQIERDMPPQPRPDTVGLQPIDIKPHPTLPGKYAHVFKEDDPALIEKQNEWADELQLRRILACWTEDIPGATTEEKIAALRTLPYYVIEALKLCVRRVIRVSGDSIKDHPFLGK